MTSKASLFNRGIYTNVLKRFKWGSIIFFIHLFVTMILPVLIFGRGMDQSLLDSIFEFSSSIFSIAYIVPVVGAVLIFGYLHSVKQGIFIHALPVSRKENYVSSLLGGLTLMLAPILVCATILTMLSGFGTWYKLSIDSIWTWVAVQTSIIFIMFAFASVSGVLTGHGVAHVAVNIILHLFPLLIAGILAIICDVFLYGFSDSGSFIGAKIAEYTPFVWLSTYDLVDSGNRLTEVAFWCYMALALVLYAVGYLLYTKRKIELCGEVVAFKIFRPILKYTVTTATVILYFAMLWGMDVRGRIVVLIMFLMGSIAYFVCEMIMSKSFKVFGRYKGYLVFCGCTAAVFLFCAFTSVFGYETRVPATDDVQCVIIHNDENYGTGKPVDMELYEEAAIEKVRSIHSELVKDVPLTDRAVVGYNRVHINYKLKNGRTLERRYQVSWEESGRIHAELYGLPGYKRRMMGVDVLNAEKVPSAWVEAQSPGNFFGSVRLEDDAPELMQAIKKDIEQLSYKELYETHEIQIKVTVMVNKKENKKIMVFDQSVFEDEYSDTSIHRLDIPVNLHFKNTIKFLKENGHYDKIVKTKTD